MSSAFEAPLWRVPRWGGGKAGFWGQKLGFTSWLFHCQLCDLAVSLFPLSPHFLIFHRENELDCAGLWSDL